MTDWIDEEPPESKTLTLESGGVRVGRGLVPWSAVLGAMALPVEAPERLYLLAPRRPPAPPWFVVPAAGLPPELLAEGLARAAQRIEARARQATYREHAGQRPVLPPSELLTRVLGHEHVPGALEVPVGHGPGAGFNRFLTVAASSSAGMATAFIAGLTLAPSLAGALAGAGFVLGAATPPGWHLLQRRLGRKPRVLVLAPDGCVIGFPSGVRAFAWTEIEGFGETLAPLPGRLRPDYPHLEVTLRDATIGAEVEPPGSAHEGGGPARAPRRGRLAAAWFDAPLALIIRVAEAYRVRQTRGT